MKIKKTVNGVELEPETSYEIECLKHLTNQSSLNVSFTDAWNKSGNLKIEGKLHPWDEAERR